METDHYYVRSSVYYLLDKKFTDHLYKAFCSIIGVLN